MSLHDDIVAAQRIVSRADFNFGDKELFHTTSAVYKISNERTQDYYSYLIGREKVLSVIGSGDQILNLILEGTKEIDAFDISSFPKYFLYLKMAAIKALSKEEYIEFFYEVSHRSEVYDDMYDRISFYLDDEISSFWDSLFNFFDWQDIYNSTLFSSEPYIAANAINQNKFLQCDAAYEELRRALDDVVINVYEGDIFDLSCKIDGTYDLVYLSNIVYYNKPDEYKEMLDEFKLTDNGITLTYLYRINKNVRDFFDKSNMEVRQFDNSESGLMISHK